MAKPRVSLDTRRLNRIINNTGKNKKKALKIAAFEVEREAKMNAPVDTGALRNSIYTRVGSNDSGDFQQVKGEVENRNEGAEVVELPRPRSEDTAVVGPSVEYAVYVEYGTHNQSAQPFLTPAVETVTSKLDRIFRQVFTDGQ